MFQMQGEEVLYQGRKVSRDGFRVFIYGRNDQKKLVNSWDEFKIHMATGIWFANVNDIPKLIEETEDEQENCVLENLINPKRVKRK